MIIVGSFELNQKVKIYKGEINISKGSIACKSSQFQKSIFDFDDFIEKTTL